MSFVFVSYSRNDFDEALQGLVDSLDECRRGWEMSDAATEKPFVTEVPLEQWIWRGPEDDPDPPVTAGPPPKLGEPTICAGGSTYHWFEALNLALSFASDVHDCRRGRKMSDAAAEKPTTLATEIPLEQWIWRGPEDDPDPPVASGPPPESGDLPGIEGPFHDAVLYVHPRHYSRSDRVCTVSGSQAALLERRHDCLFL
jgi:hypothetical protein